MSSQISKKVSEFFSKYKEQKYKKGELLVRADDSPSGIFYIKEGMVKEYAISKKGDELVLNVFRPQTFFPMSWAINNSQNDYFFEAVTSLTVNRAPKEEVIEFIKANPDVMYDLLSRVYNGTDGMMTRITYLMAGNAHGRLITELLIQAKRFGKTVKESTEMNITEKELASQSGMTRETVSREMRVLKNKKLVSFIKNNLVIHNLKQLEQELVEGV